MSYVVHDGLLPLLLVQRTGNADAEGVARMLEWTRAQVMAAPSKVTFVYDSGGRSGGLPDAAARKVGGEWVARYRTMLREKVVGLDFALASPLSRGALTAVFWIAAPPVPWAMHASLEEALDAALARCGSRRTREDVLTKIRRAP